MPTEYELVTSKLLYYTKRGFEVETPISEWYRKYQKASSVQVDDWDQFRDPRETTYTKYTQIQRDKEIYTEGIFNFIEQTNYDDFLSMQWKASLFALLSTLRYPYHGLQMIASYVGSMAPGGRITIAAALQAADEKRKVETIAYRLAQLNEKVMGDVHEARVRWEREPHWQPLRKLIEMLFVTYDWAEAFVALNICLKPKLDDFVLIDVAQLAKKYGDNRLTEIFFSLKEDSDWQRDWTAALRAVMEKGQTSNAAAVEAWIAKWQPLAEEAISTLKKDLLDD